MNATQNANTAKAANAPSNRKPKVETILPGSDRLLPETEAERIAREQVEATEANRQLEAEARRKDAEARDRDAKAQAEANEILRKMLADEEAQAEAEYRRKLVEIGNGAANMTRGKLEATIVLRKLEALIDEAGQLGNEAKIGAFQLLGGSTGKAGKPKVANAMLVMAISAGSPETPFSTRMQWAQTANKATVAGAKGPYTVKSVGGATGGQASYTLGMPE